MECKVWKSWRTDGRLTQSKNDTNANKIAVDFCRDWKYNETRRVFSGQFSSILIFN